MKACIYDKMGSDFEGDLSLPQLVLLPIYQESKCYVLKEKLGNLTSILKLSLEKLLGYFLPISLIIAGY